MPIETWTRGAHHEVPPDAAYVFGHSDGGVQWLTIEDDPPPETTGGAAHTPPHRNKHTTHD